MGLPWGEIESDPKYLTPKEFIAFLNQLVEDGYEDDPIWVRSWEGEHMWRVSRIELHEDDTGEAWFELT